MRPSRVPSILTAEEAPASTFSARQSPGPAVLATTTATACLETTATVVFAAPLVVLDSLTVVLQQRLSATISARMSNIAVVATTHASVDRLVSMVSAIATMATALVRMAALT